MDILTEKTCSQCTESKSPSAFNRSSRSKDGRDTVCRECRKALRREKEDRYRRNNRESIAARQREYASDNRSYYRQRSEAWRQENKDSRSEYNRTWKAQNRENVRASIARRKQREVNGLDSTDILLSIEYRKAIKDDPCFYCGNPGEHDEHFFPLAKGGTDHWWNLVRACASCNFKKNARCGTWFILKEART